MSRFNILGADLETQKPAVVAKTEKPAKAQEKKVEAKPAQPEKKVEAKQEKPQEKKQAPAAAPKQQAPTKTSSGLTIVRKGEAKAEDGEFQKVDHSANPRKHIQRETVVPREGKRQYERRDGTGRAHEGDKKQGAGKGNWGKPEDASIKDAPIDDKEAKEVKEVVADKPVEPEEPPKKTMEEYLAAQKSTKPAIKAPKMRVANEGEKNLDKKWGETIELKNPDLPEKKAEEKKAEEKKAEEKKAEEKKAEEKKEKKVAVPLEKVFSVVTKPVHEPRKYDNKEEKPQQHAPKQQTKALELTNAAEFPTLGGKK